MEYNCEYPHSDIFTLFVNNAFCNICVYWGSLPNCPKKYTCFFFIVVDDVGGVVDGG